MSCNCNVTLGNTGTPGCPNIFEVGYKPIFTSYYTSTGAVNEITISGTLNEAFFTALVANADPFLKWFPTPKIDNVESASGEPVFETLGSGKQIFIRDGVRGYSWAWVNLDTIFLGKIANLKCKELGMFLVDQDGNLIGMEGSTPATKLKPIKIDKDTLVASLMLKGYESAQKINANVQFDLGMNDADLRMVAASELTSYDLKNISGLIDVIGNTASSISTTGFTMIMKTYYGTPLNPIKVLGLVAADFTLYNVTDSASVTISTVTETSGSYAFTFTAQTSADVLRLSCTEAGYDDTVLETVVITIP